MKNIDGSNHRWARFCNPRNQTVVVVACVECGRVKSDWSQNIRCIPIARKDHPMLRLGWQRFAKLHASKSPGTRVLSSGKITTSKVSASKETLAAA